MLPEIRQPDARGRRLRRLRTLLVLLGYIGTTPALQLLWQAENAGSHPSPRRFNGEQFWLQGTDPGAKLHERRHMLARRSVLRSGRGLQFP